MCFHYLLIMQKRLLIVLSLLSLILPTSSCQTGRQPALPKLPAADAFQLNQAGYAAHGSKRAVIVGANRSPFFLLSEAGDTLFQGTTGPEMVWDASAQWAAEADFSDYDGSVSVHLVVPEIGSSGLIDFSANPALQVMNSMINSLYFQRCSEVLPGQTAGPWARAAGHPDLQVEIHPSATSETRTAGSLIQAPGGWYDAGDYGKYCGPTAFVTWSLFHLMELDPSFSAVTLRIPESSNEWPDLLDEGLVGLRFLLRVQDPDGSVPHKLTALHHAAQVMPDADDDPRYLIGKDAAVNFTFAACMAQASRILRAYQTELPGLADSCFRAAEQAWAWGCAHEDQHFRNPSGVSTGEYKDDFIEDEKAWAALELWLSSEDKTYRQPERLFEVVQSRNTFHGDASWKAMLSLSLHADRLTESEQIQWTEQLKWRSNRMKEYARFNPYHVPLGFNEYDFNWGSNAIHAREGLWYLMTARWTGDSSWESEAQRVADYTLGMNPLDLSFVTGIGERYPVDPHHRPSKADAVAEPVPGFMVGGPQTVVKQQDCPEYPSDLPALHYLDAWCSYTTNEVAINYNACGWLLLGWLAATSL